MTPVRAGDVVPINVGRYNQLFILRADPQGPGVDVPGATVTLEHSVAVNGMRRRLHQVAPRAHPSSARARRTSMTRRAAGPRDRCRACLVGPAACWTCHSWAPDDRWTVGSRTVLPRVAQWRKTKEPHSCCAEHCCAPSSDYRTALP